jgi:hypothetical protein
LVLLIPVTRSFGQTSTVSPYSRFGPGDLLFNGYAHQQGMGGVSYAATSTGRLNFSNPASYAFDTLMVLEFGLNSLAMNQKQGGAHHNQMNTNIDYLAIGFPLMKNKWGLSFGIIPFSGAGYKVATSNPIDSSGSYTSRFNGTGGFTRYFVGTGFKLNNHLSLGANASYLYGTVNRIRKVEFTNPNFFNTQYQDGLNIGDFYFELGANYKTKVNEKYDFSIGLTGAPAQGLRSKKSVLWQNYVLTSIGSESMRDTIDYFDDVKGITKLPLALGLGFMLSHSKQWDLGLDFSYQDWSHYKSFGREDTLSNSFGVALGGQLTPDAKGNYASRTQYRAGVYFHRTFLDLKDTPLNDEGFSIGVGLPLRKAFQSMINISLQAGQRGTTSNDLISEKYLRLAIGFTFNEDWFRKRKFD